MKMRSYIIMRNIARPFVKVLFRYKLENKENIPDAPFIICANHIAMSDALCTACTITAPTRYMCKVEFEKKPVVGALLRGLRVIFVNRAKADLGSIRQCVETIKAGYNVGIFPQGTRVREQPKPEQAQDGMAMICGLSKATVLPVALIYKSKNPRIFSRCRVVVGKPVPYEEYNAVGDRKEQTRYLFGKVCEMIENDGNKDS